MKSSLGWASRNLLSVTGGTGMTVEPGTLIGFKVTLAPKGPQARFERICVAVPGL